ncbi:MAG: hypothetical protein C0423_21720 [Methylibium sp.]|nr:hypothetical protein [Methylibium sp.]
MSSSSRKPSRPLDPRKLDLEAMARDAQSLSGEWAASELLRLAESAAPEAPATEWPAIDWAARAELRAQRGAEPQIWLHLKGQAQVRLSCQRCLQPVQEDLSIDRWIRFVRDEEMAAELDAEGDDDVLALSGRLDLQQLVEDELLLALPLVPRHEQCPQPLPLAVGEEDIAEEVEKPNPFAALAALKGKPKS